jgi:hypothetical protein
MPIKVTCTNCGGVLHAPDDAAGKRGRCPSCGTVLTIPADGPAAAAVPPAPEPPAAPRPLPTPAAAPAGPKLGGGTGNYALAGDDRSAPARPAADNGLKGSLGGSPIAPPPRPGAAFGSKVPPDPRGRAADPFARPGPATGPRPTEELARRWKRVKGGLGWVQAAAVFAWLAVVGAAGVPIAQQFGVQIPDGTALTKIDGLTQATEIKLAAVLVPLALGLLCLVFGRLAVAAAPPESFGRGPARWAALATLLVLAGVVGGAGVTGVALSASVPPPARMPVGGGNLQARAESLVQQTLLASDEGPGIAQRFSVLAVLVFGLLAEVWCVAALGRFAAALQSSRAAGRVNRFVIYVGLLLAVTAFGLLAYDLFGTQWVAQNVTARWYELDAKQQILVSGGAAIGVGFVLMVVYLRLAGGVRAAVREYLDAAPAA